MKAYEYFCILMTVVMSPRLSRPVADLLAVAYTLAAVVTFAYDLYLRMNP